MISPHYKNNLKPLRSKSSERSRMTVPFSALLPIVLVRPLTSPERIKRKPVDGMSQVLVTGKSKKKQTALATELGDGEFNRFVLDVAIGLPAIASPSSAQSLATVVPLFPPGRVFTSSAAGIETKKRSTSSL